MRGGRWLWCKLASGWRTPQFGIRHQNDEEQRLIDGPNGGNWPRWAWYVGAGELLISGAARERTMLAQHLEENEI